MPRAVALIELVVGFDAQQFVVQALRRDRGAVGRNDHDVERRAGAVGQRAAREQRLDADHVAARRDRQRDLVLDGTAARLRHAHRDAGFERVRARRQLVDIDVEGRLAGVVGGRQIVQRLLHGGDVFAVEAELIAGKAGALGRHGDIHVAFEIEARGRRAIEEAAGKVDGGRIGFGDRPARRRQIEFDPLGHVVLDQERGLADRRALRVGEDVHVPGAGRR